MSILDDAVCPKERQSLWQKLDKNELALEIRVSSDRETVWYKKCDLRNVLTWKPNSSLLISELFLNQKNRYVKFFFPFLAFEEKGDDQSNENERSHLPFTRCGSAFCILWMSFWKSHRVLSKYPFPLHNIYILTNHLGTYFLCPKYHLLSNHMCFILKGFRIFLERMVGHLESVKPILIFLHWQEKLAIDMDSSLAKIEWAKSKNLDNRQDGVKDLGPPFFDKLQFLSFR